MNLKNLKVKLVDGSTIKIDIAKDIANIIYLNTGDLGMLDIAMTLYKKGEVILDDNQIKEIVKILNKIELKAFIKKAILEELNYDLK